MIKFLILLVLLISCNSNNARLSIGSNELSVNLPASVSINSPVSFTGTCPENGRTITLTIENAIPNEITGCECVQNSYTCPETTFTQIPSSLNVGVNDGENEANDITPAQSMVSINNTSLNLGTPIIFEGTCSPNAVGSIDISILGATPNLIENCDCINSEYACSGVTFTALPASVTILATNTEGVGGSNEDSFEVDSPSAVSLDSSVLSLGTDSITGTCSPNAQGSISLTLTGATPSSLTGCDCVDGVFDCATTFSSLDPSVSILSTNSSGTGGPTTDTLAFTTEESVSINEIATLSAGVPTAITGNCSPNASGNVSIGIAGATPSSAGPCDCISGSYDCGSITFTDIPTDPSIVSTLGSVNDSTDPSAVYTVDLTHPGNVQSGTPITLSGSCSPSGSNVNIAIATSNPSSVGPCACNAGTFTCSPVTFTSLPTTPVFQTTYASASDTDTANTSSMVDLNNPGTISTSTPVSLTGVCSPNGVGNISITLASGYIPATMNDCDCVNGSFTCDPITFSQIAATPTITATETSGGSSDSDSEVPNVTPEVDLNALPSEMNIGVAYTFTGTCSKEGNPINISSTHSVPASVGPCNCTSGQFSCGPVTFTSLESSLTFTAQNASASDDENSQSGASITLNTIATLNGVDSTSLSGTCAPNGVGNVSIDLNAEYVPNTISNCDCVAGAFTCASTVFTEVGLTTTIGANMTTGLNAPVSASITPNVQREVTALGDVLAGATNASPGSIDVSTNDSSKLCNPTYTTQNLVNVSLDESNAPTYVITPQDDNLPWSFSYTATCIDGTTLSQASVTDDSIAKFVNASDGSVATCPLEFSSKVFNLTTIGGGAAESFADDTALKTQLDNLTSSTWTYNSGSCEFQSLTAGSTDLTIEIALPVCSACTLSSTSVVQSFQVSDLTTTPANSGNFEAIIKDSNDVVVASYAGGTFYDVNEHYELGDKVSLLPGTYTAVNVTSDCQCEANFTVADYDTCTNLIKQSYSGPTAGPGANPTYELPVNTSMTNLDLSFVTEGVADKIVVEYNNNIIHDSGFQSTGIVPYTASVPFTYVSGVETLSVTVNPDPNSGSDTVWSFSLGCCLGNANCELKQRDPVIADISVNSGNCATYARVVYPYTTLDSYYHSQVSEMKDIWRSGRPGCYTKNLLNPDNLACASNTSHSVNLESKDDGGTYTNLGSVGNSSFYPFQLSGSCRGQNYSNDTTCDDTGSATTFISATSPSSGVYEYSFPAGGSYSLIKTRMQTHTAGKSYPMAMVLFYKSGTCVSDATERYQSMNLPLGTVITYDDINEKIIIDVSNNTGTNCCNSRISSSNTFLLLNEAKSIYGVSAQEIIDPAVIPNRWLRHTVTNSCGSSYTNEYYVDVADPANPTTSWSLYKDGDENTGTLLNSHLIHQKLVISGFSNDTSLYENYRCNAAVVENVNTNQIDCSEVDVVAGIDLTPINANATQTSFADGAAVATYLQGITGNNWQWHDKGCFPYNPDNTSGRLPQMRSTHPLQL